MISRAKFQKTIYDYYAKNKRSFPWRETKDPYKILVSEIMLQQTQTDRVVTKYNEWLKHFPTFKMLAEAPLQKVLTHWQGLGYNRRALNLKRAAEVVTRDYKGKLPDDYEKILDLPGIGPYTAGAVMAFAFNKPFPIIETNIRTVYIHFFFRAPRSLGEVGSDSIYDKEILTLVEKTLDTKCPREWYYALMDYGVMLKKTLGNLNTRSRHYNKQSKFEGSNRQIRSAIVKAITLETRSLKDLETYLRVQKLEVTEVRLQKNLADLEKEGFIKNHKNYYHIST
jgi:A/G-specific adenine glycosylase